MRTLCMSVLCFAAMGLAWCSQQAVSRNAASSNAPRSVKQSDPVPAVGEIGSRMPDFSVKGLRGREIRSADFRGKVALIDFWATWCKPCEKEMPGYQRLLDRYGASGFVVVGLKFDTMMDTEDPLSFAKRNRVRYPLAVASDDLKQRFGGIEGLPTTMLYDRQGILRKKIIGFEYTKVVEEDLKRLL